jgi:hypothetical protein
MILHLLHDAERRNLYPDVDTRFRIKRKWAWGDVRNYPGKTDVERRDAYRCDADTRTQIKRRSLLIHHTARRRKPESDRCDAYLPDADTITRSNTSRGMPWNTGWQPEGEHHSFHRPDEDAVSNESKMSRRTLEDNTVAFRRQEPWGTRT